MDSAEHKRAALLKQADVRCLDAAAKFAGLMGPLQLVEQGMGMVRHSRAAVVWLRLQL